MRYLISALLLMLASQDGSFEGTVTATTAFKPGQHSTVTFTEKWPRERYDIVTKDRGKLIVLYDLEKGSRTVIVPSRKVYWTVDVSERAKQWRDAVERAGYTPGPATIVVAPTTRTDKIAGRTCKYFTVGYEQEADVCAASGMGEYIADQEIDGARAMGGKGPARDTMYDDLGSRFPGGFFPLKIVSRADGPERVVWQVTSIDRHPVPDDTFDVPPGYTQTAPPRIQ